MTQTTALTRTGPADFLLAPTTLKEAIEYAEYICRSAVIPKNYIGKAPDVLVAIQLGMELGLPPLQSLQSIAVINGSPSVYGDGLIAIVRGSRLCKFIAETFDDATLTATCTALRRGDADPQSRSFSQADATTAGLWNKQGPWQQYPKRMLQMRARAWCLRDLFPDVLKGVAVREEIEDYRDMGTAERVYDQPAAGSRSDQVKQRIKEQRGQQDQPADANPAATAKSSSAQQKAAVPENGMSTSAATNEAAKTDTPKLPDVDALCERINQADARTELEALGNVVDDFPRGSQARKTLVAVLKARKAALEKTD